MYAIAKVLSEKMKELNLSKRELAEKMEYKNIQNGINNIHQLITGLYYNKQILQNIQKVLNIESQLFEIAVYATEQKINLDSKIKELTVEINFRKIFSPFLYKKTELSRPSSITMAAICGGDMKFATFVKEFIKLSFEERLNLVSKFIVRDFAKREGICPFFGKITGYYFQYDFDTCAEFDTNGNIIDIEIKDLKLYPTPFARPYLIIK